MIKILSLLTLLLSLNSFASTKVVFLVEGMTCASCAGAIEKQLREIEGVDKVDISIKDGKVAITSKNGSNVNSDKAKHAIERGGYKAKLVDNF